MLTAIQQRVEELGARAVFDAIDMNRSGRASADELAAAVRGMGIQMDDDRAEDLIKAINTRHGSKRKALTYDTFCAPTPPRAWPRQLLLLLRVCAAS